MYKQFFLFCIIIAHVQLSAISWNPLEWGKVEQKTTKSYTTYWQRVQRHASYVWLKTIQKDCTHKLYEAQTYAKTHPLATALLGGSLSVLSVAHYLNSLQTDAQEENFWSTWHSDRHIITKNSTEETHELLHAIQVRYIDIEDITDFVGPIKLFMQDVDTKLNQLRAYRRLAALLQKTGFNFLVDTNAYCHAQEKIEHLSCLKLLCVQWLSKTKLTFAVV